MVWHVSEFHSLLLLNAIPVYGYTTFIHSTIGGHLDCFQLATIMNNAAMTFVNKFLCEHMFSFLLVIYLGVELLGHMVVLFLVF